MDSSTIRSTNPRGQEQVNVQPAQIPSQNAINQRGFSNNPGNYQQQQQQQYQSQQNVLKSQPQIRSQAPVQNPQNPSNFQVSQNRPPQQYQVQQNYQPGQQQRPEFQQRTNQVQNSQPLQRPPQGQQQIQQPLSGVNQQQIRPNTGGQNQNQNPPPRIQQQIQRPLQNPPLHQNPTFNPNQVRPAGPINSNPQFRPQVPNQQQSQQQYQGPQRPPQQARPLPSNIDQRNIRVNQPNPNMSSDVLRGGRNFTTPPNQNNNDASSVDDNDDVVLGRAETPQSSANSQNRTPSSTASRTPEPGYNRTTPPTSMSPDGLLNQSNVNLSRGPSARQTPDPNIQRTDSIKSIPSRPPSVLEPSNSQSPEPKSMQNVSRPFNNQMEHIQSSNEQNFNNSEEYNEPASHEIQRRKSFGKKMSSEEEIMQSYPATKPSQPSTITPASTIQQPNTQNQMHQPQMQSQSKPTRQASNDLLRQLDSQPDQMKNQQVPPPMERKKSVERKKSQDLLQDHHVPLSVSNGNEDKYNPEPKDKEEKYAKPSRQPEKTIEPRKKSSDRISFEAINDKDNNRPSTLDTSKKQNLKSDKVKSPRFAKGDNDSGVDESTQEKERNGHQSPGSPLKSPSKIPSYKPRPESITPKSRSRSTSKQRLSLLTTPDTPEPEPLIKKVPMNKIQVGAAPSPNLKQVRSKIGSLDNATHRPGGGNVKIESKKLDIKAAPRIEAKNDAYIPRGGDKKILSQKLNWNAKSKIGSLENADHKPGGGDKRILEVKTNFKEKAKPRVGSKDNVGYKPGGGEVKIVNQKIEVHAAPKIGSLDNVKHKPGGGDKKIFDDKEYLRNVDHPVQPSPPSQFKKFTFTRK